MQLSYEVTTTTFTSVLRLQDTSKLTTFEKINTMAYKDQVKNVATMDAAGDFNIVITRTARPSLGGKPLPLDDVSEVTVTPRGISTNTGETYPFEPDEYQNMVSTAKTLSSFVAFIRRNATSPFPFNSSPIVGSLISLNISPE